ISGVDLPAAGPGPRLNSAATGWAIVTLLSLAGCGLLALGVSAGAPAWAAWAFVLVSGLAGAAYGTSVFRFYRRMEARMPEGEAAARKLSGRLVSSFGDLGAGDLVRSVSRTADLPRRVAQAFSGAAGSLAGLAEQIQDSSIEVASAADEVNRI